MNPDSRSGKSGRRRRIAFVALVVLPVVLVVIWRFGESADIAEPKGNRHRSQPEKTVREKVIRAQSGVRFRPFRVIPAQPAIRDAPFISADKVREQVSDNELVLGVVVNDEARAYPINMLTGPSREIINDTLGGKALAATW